MAKLTAAQIKEQTKKVLAQIEKSNQRARGKDQHLNQFRPEEVERRLKRGDAPFFYQASWDAEARPGGVIRLRSFVWNPAHPNLANSIYIHAWVGTGNVDPVIGTALLNVDARFPRLTEPRFAGLRPGMMAPDTAGSEPNVISLDINLKVPTAIEPSNYIGNICLMQLGGVASIDQGVALDRDTFVFTVLP